MRSHILWALLIGAICRVNSTQAQSLSLSFDSLPSSQGWSYGGTPSETSAYSVDGTRLILNTLAMGPAHGHTHAEHARLNRRRPLLD